MRIWRGPNVWHLDRLLSVPQIYLSARADRKMVIFYVYLRYLTKKSRLYRTDDTQIKKFGVWRKNLRTPSYAYLHICIFSKEITALLTVLPPHGTHLPSKAGVFLMKKVKHMSLYERGGNMGFSWIPELSPHVLLSGLERKNGILYRKDSTLEHYCNWGFSQFR